MITDTTFLAEGDDFLCAFVIKVLVLLIGGDSLVVVRSAENNPVCKANRLKNLAKVLVYQVRRGIRFYAYPCLAARIM